jgi:hypothetical protein
MMILDPTAGRLVSLVRQLLSHTRFIMCSLFMHTTTTIPFSPFRHVLNFARSMSWVDAFDITAL